ncbi:MAG TPA: PHP domain-containing protein [Coriobacteriia bacterium]|nr:PHP domain-containing protein [Coriobacteriia bacterium]
MAIDLHTHSTASDGELSPAGVVYAAHAAGLTAIALSDHDSVEGVSEALESGVALGVTVVPAVELSAEHESGLSVHILGYFVDYADPTLLAYLAELRDVRHTRARQMVEELQRDGYEITFDDVMARSDGGAVGRAHVAQALLAADRVASVREAFDTLIGEGRPYYVRKPVPGPAEVVATVRAAGGLAVLAHPAVSATAHLAQGLVGAGLEGLEALHAQHTAAERDEMARLAERLGLVVTGGSDFHGEMTTDTPIGAGDVPDAVLDVLITRAGDRARGFGTT